MCLTHTAQLQVWHLASLPNLSQLLFSDPDWGASPIAKLCNYATYAAVNLPNLQVLDSQPLSPQTKAVAEATYLKKKMYYNMRINTLRRKGADLAQQAQQGLQVHISHRYLEDQLFAELSLMNNFLLKFFSVYSHCRTNQSKI